jgi:type II secretory pathway pseudopilin PulG
MKTTRTTTGPVRGRRTSAFTLVEVMVGVGIFLGIFVGVMVGLQIFGLRVYTLAATKLTATADARKTLNALRDEITNGFPQTGNALELYFADTNDVPGEVPVIYYQNSSQAANALYRDGDDSVRMMANYVTNYYVFTAEDYMAHVLTSYDNNPVIRVTMNFLQWQYPIGMVGNGGIDSYNYYRLQTRVSRRTKE